ncbi:MAG: hypothetical protein GYA58_06960 [Anaerolineaceae bacterium]|jgi:hypothetical protein|nr:hypothetical protein [Anaerolineaceae bacterium]
MFRKNMPFISIIIIAALLTSCSSTPTPSVPNYSIVGTQGSFHLVVIDKSLDSDKEGLRTVANDICKDQNICIVIFWDDPNNAAHSLPMTDEQVNTRVAAYNLNESTGLDRLLICSIDGC